MLKELLEKIRVWKIYKEYLKNKPEKLCLSIEYCMHNKKYYITIRKYCYIMEEFYWEDLYFNDDCTRYFTSKSKIYNKEFFDTEKEAIEVAEKMMDLHNKKVYNFKIKYADMIFGTKMYKNSEEYKSKVFESE